MLGQVGKKSGNSYYCTQTYTRKPWKHLLLPPAHCLSLARQYQLLDWISAAVRTLLKSPLERYTQDSKPEEKLDFALYMVIATTTRESMAGEHNHLGNHPPFPPNFDNEPFYSQHAMCKKVWTEKWFFTVVHRIHNPSVPLPLSLVPGALEEIGHQGMNPKCKRSILTWLRESCGQVQKEEALILDAITTIGNMFTL